MAKASELRTHVGALRVSTCLFAAPLVAALSVAPIAISAAQNPSVSRSFGDTAEFGVRILSIHPDSEVATFSAPSSKHLIVLEVVPGRSIDVLYPGPSAASFKKDKGSNAFRLPLYRMTAVSNDAEQAAAERTAEDAYRRCVAAADAAARRAEAAKRTRDASGKETGPSISQVMTASSDATPGGNRCGRPNAPARTVKYVRLPPRVPADRYLVVLSSSADMSLAELNLRLAQLTSVGNDVATVIEATASGLYFGKTEKWGGAFIPW